MSLVISPSIKSESWFEALDFSDPIDGKLFVYHARPGSPSVLTAATKLFGQPSPISYDSETVGEAFEIGNIRGKNFSYRLCAWNHDHQRLEALPLPDHDQFWLGCSYELINTDFLKAGKKTHDKFKELILNFGILFDISYEGQHFPLDVKRPNYILELLTEEDAQTSSILMEKLLHDQYLAQWRLSLPAHHEVLDTIHGFMHENIEKIVAKVRRDEFDAIKIESSHKSSPRAVVFRLKDRRVEAFIIYHNKAYGLTNFTTYFLKSIRHPRRTERLFQAVEARKALYDVFMPSFKYDLEGEGLFYAFDMQKMSGFQKVVETLLKSHQVLPSKALDSIMLTFLRNVSLIHGQNLELGYLSLDLLYLQTDRAQGAQKLFLYKAHAKTGSFHDLRSLGCIAYNLWVLYKNEGELTFYDESDAGDPKTCARIVQETKAYLANPSIDPVWKDRLNFILLLLEGEIEVKQAYEIYQVHYNKRYYAIDPSATAKALGSLGEAALFHSPSTTACGGAGSSSHPSGK